MRGFFRVSFLSTHFGGPNRDRTDDLTDANRTLSQLSYRPIFGCFVYFCLFCLCGLLFWPGPCYVALALPTELRARLCLVWINLTHLDCAICWSAWARVMLPLLSQLSYEPKYLIFTPELSPRFWRQEVLYHNFCSCKARFLQLQENFGRSKFPVANSRRI